MRRLCLLLLLSSAPAWATPYIDPISRLHFNVPPGWQVHAARQGGQRVLRVVPPKADQRERAAIEVSIKLRKPGQADRPAGLMREYRQGDGDREAATVLRNTPRAGRLVMEYREGRFVSSQLWIVRNNLHVFQRDDDERLAEARCAANASEFKTYRRQLETICLSLQWPRR